MHVDEPQVQIIGSAEGSVIITTTNSDIVHEDVVANEREFAKALNQANRALARADEKKANEEAKNAAAQAKIDMAEAEAAEEARLAKQALMQPVDIPVQSDSFTGLSEAERVAKMEAMGIDLSEPEDETALTKLENDPVLDNLASKIKDK